MKLYDQLKPGLWYYVIGSSILFIGIVIVLGFITPGYNHLHHTISRLAVEKYGWVQTLNFLQFGITVFLSGLLISSVIASKASQRLWLMIFTLSSLMWLTMALFPTDKVEESQVMLSELSLNGIIHLGGVFTVFLLFPFGVHALSRSLTQEPPLSKYARFTSLCGYTVSLLCYIWTIFFLTHQFTQYLGIFQKIIAGICMYWMISILWAIKPSGQT